MVEETTLDVSGEQSDPGANLAGDSSSPQDAGTTSSGDVQSHPPDQQPTEIDPLEGVPNLEELSQQEHVPYAKALAQLRTAYETLKPQYDELSGKFKPFEPVADQFTAPEEVQKLIDLQQNLYGWDTDPESGQLVPATHKVAEQLVQDSPLHADYLFSDLAGSIAPDGRMRAAHLLETLREDPQSRELALRILGGVDPSTVVQPSWAPSEDELEPIKPELRDVYKKLPYETREELKLASPEFINDHLRKEKIIQDTENERQERVQQQEAYQQQQTQKTENEAVEAGNQFIDQEIRQGFEGFYARICEKWQPTDDPNTNRTAGALVAALVVNLAHSETRSVTEKALKETALLDDESIQAFDTARNNFAQNAYNFGYLSRKNQNTQNGQNGQSTPLNLLKSQSSKSLQSVVAQGNKLATKIIRQLDKLFLAKANAHNNVLDQATGARPPINGNPVNPAINPGSPQIAGKEPFSDESVTRFARRS